MDLIIVSLLCIIVICILYESLLNDISKKEQYYHPMFKPEKQNISVFKKVINSSCSGIIRGAFIGYLTGGSASALSGSLIYGLANPILTYTEHNFYSDESL